MWTTYYSGKSSDKSIQFEDLHIVSLWQWQKIWRDKFPHVSIRKYKQVTGKCWTCYRISSGRRKAENRLIQLYYKKLFLCHRGGCFMLERKQYKKRAAASVSDPTRKLSIILDGMDQNHCRVPQTGTQLQYGGKQVTQHITGCLRHTPDIDGISLTIYRNYCNISKGSNLTIHCILLQLQKFYLQYRQFPEEFCIQLDGGSENANNCLLGFLELLVARRIVRKVTFTRLPVGHTHEVNMVFNIR